MRILFADATQEFSPDKKDTKACGGILTSLTILPQYLASKGHEVIVKSSYPETKTINGVKYIPIGDNENLPKWDVIVVNRNGINNGLVQYSHSIGAKVIWWLHDIVDFRYLADASYRRVDHIVALSEYCKNSYADFYDLPLDRFSVIPNAVDKTVFYPGKYEDRTPYKMIMGSALIKGFKPVYDTWMNVRRQFPNATLTIYSSQELHGLKDNSIQKAFLQEMETNGATIQRPISQAILADKMRSSWALLMPNDYPEICSNLLLQAQACGLPVVTSAIGSTPEFIDNGKSGILTEYAPHDLFLWIKKYAEAVVTLFKDKQQHKIISDNAPKGVLSWDQVGEAWNEMVKKVTQKD
jgi:glycosyltransferase involved in cell wall biosynthesis